MDPPGNGSGRPEELPELPPEWGRIVVPDDAAALATEAAEVRRELRRQARRAPGQRPAGPGPQPTPRLALLIMSIAVLITLGSLIAVIWPGGAVTPPRGPGDGGTAGDALHSRAPDPGRVGRPLPALDLVDEGGRPVALRALLPAVIVFVDGCDCAARLRQAAAVVPPEVTVVALISDGAGPRPAGSPVSGGIRTLADPTGGLRAFLGSSPGGSEILLVARSGRVARVLPAGLPLTDHQQELADLATG